MRTDIAVINTDQLNRQNMRIPVGTLTQAVESLVGACARRGLPIGTPMHIAHDMHRPIGWAASHLIHMGPDMARQLATLHRPETQAERVDYEKLRADYWCHHYHDEVAPYAHELTQRLSPADLTTARWIKAEASSFARAGLAAELYPGLFKAGEGLVDKDGLVNYAALRERMKEVQWGVFRDPERDVVLFAHRFFRRSLAHENVLNHYALGTFGDIAARHPGIVARLRLDPDIVGHPGSVHRNIELEYWRGPRFSDDIASIHNGVAEHKADENQRFFGGIDKTQVWWKGPDTRERKAAELRPTAPSRSRSWSRTLARALGSTPSAAATHTPSSTKPPPSSPTSTAPSEATAARPISGASTPR